MRKLLFSAIALNFVLACSSSQDDKDSSEAMVPVITDSAQAAALANASKETPLPASLNTNTLSLPTEVGSVNPPHGKPGHRCDIPDGATIPAKSTIVPAVASQTPQPATTPVNLPQGVQLPQTTTAAAAQSGSTPAGINPPHGKPGHRCDIPDGAPLNSAPAKPAATASGSLPQNLQIAKPSTSSQPSQKGMNPEHGKPGHRCDIAVGAPLDSKPAAAGQSAENKPAENKASTPSPLIQPVSNGGVTLNPPHGQPGHDCAIEVGKPLKKQ